jgi:hypothetical protein
MNGPVFSYHGIQLRHLYHTIFRNYLFGKIPQTASGILKLDILVKIVIMVISGGCYGKNHISS